MGKCGIMSKNLIFGQSYMKIAVVLAMSNKMDTKLAYMYQNFAKDD